LKVRTDEALIESRQRIGRWAAFGGLAILIGGLVISFRSQTPAMVGVTYGALVVGMFLSSIGIYLADKWVQEPRSDQALENALRGFDDRYTLYNYVLPAEHVLLTPYGLIVLAVKRQGDAVRYADGKWRHEQSLYKRIQGLSRERLGDPIRQMETDIQQMNKLIGAALPDMDADVPVEGAVVFTHPEVKLDTGAAPADVVHVKKLQNYVRRADKRQRRLKEEVRQELEGVLDEAAQTNASALVLDAE
jgi:hypothetical protein